jgi:hypothetical protein
MLNHMYKKDKNTLRYKYVINVFEYLNDFECKNSKLVSCRSHQDLQFLYKNYFHLISQKIYDLI